MRAVHSYHIDVSDGDIVIGQMLEDMGVPMTVKLTPEQVDQFIIHLKEAKSHAEGGNYDPEDLPV